MELAFDLISDLHLESWEQNDWTGRATSHHCVVAGDVCKDRTKLIEFLQHLSTCYQGVFYIDGNDEHKYYMDKLSASYRDLANKISTIPNVIYLQDNVVVINGVAIVGTNGWWSFDFDLGINAEQSRQWLEEKENYSKRTTEQIKRFSSNDANYVISSVRQLQTHPDVKKIVIVTHTVPRPDLIDHDPTIEGALKFNAMGNRYLQSALAIDTEHKIHTWCFGHYHGKIDQYRDGIRWVNNCRGRQHTAFSQWAYNPLRIVVEY